MGLMLDYARITGNAEFGKLVESRARDYYLKDRNCPLAYEPSGEDFLSPCLAEADVVRRILPPAEFAEWFTAFLAARGSGTHPRYRRDRWQALSPGRSEPQPRLDAGGHRFETSGRRCAPQVSHRARRRAQATGLDSIKSEHYEGGHWLGSFAVYLVSGRGLR